MSRRIRTIKPEILDHPATALLSHAEYRLFIGCIVMADDYGNFSADPRYVGGQVFWAHEGERGPAAVVALLDQLESSKLIRRYVVDDRPYLNICGWGRHQKIDKPGKPQVPPPPKERPIDGPSTNVRRKLVDGSPLERDQDRDRDPDREQESSNEPAPAATGDLAQGGAPGAIILAALERHACLSSVATASMADVLAGLVQPGTPLDVALRAIDEAAHKAAGAAAAGASMPASKLAERLVSFVMQAHKPRGHGSRSVQPSPTGTRWASRARNAKGRPA
jgi:hypothetical protein